MSPVDALSTFPPTVPNPSESLSPAASPQISNLAQMMDAFSSQTGVAIRLIVSLPANLGQSLDTSV